MRLFVEQLTNLDFSYLDTKRGLVGETWLANIELEGQLDEQGMVVDFGDIKKKLRHWLDTHLDHKLLVPTRNRCLTLHSENARDVLTWKGGKGTIYTNAPSEAQALVDVEHITPDSVAQWCREKLKALFPASVATLSLYFTTESIDGPYYHYTHGLKKHLGNCQRIAHGHRSKIELWQNEHLANDAMLDWAKQWQDIYIGTHEDCQVDNERSGNYLFQYNAQQGYFELSVPQNCCYLIETESTVELLAQHIYETLSADTKHNDRWRVKAFEGIAKGAIAEK